MSNSLRIIGGEWRRRVLRFPDALGLRPTPDRVRETLFNWLGQDLTGLSCLDLFAGSGALGFEAVSRGAARVVMVERDPVAVAALRDNAKALAASRVEIVRGDALQFAATPRPEAKRFDVIFLDPPYRQGWLDRLAPLLGGLAGEDSMIYAEAEHPVTSLGAWSVVRQGRAGQVYFHLLQRQRATDENDAG